ncbi:MAG: G8 domain-containing protein, partial [Chloroflexi bacterium]|nr:G8 domain-containing protein [Chloroflexota bacterium]
MPALRVASTPVRRIIYSALILGIITMAAVGAGRSLIAAGSLVTSADSGSWSDPMIWKQGRIPGKGDRVEIAKGTQVVYDLFSRVEIGEIVVEGTLRFSRNRDTNLDVGMFTVNPGGALEIGTETNPIPGDVKATIRIVNKEEGENSIDIFGRADIHGQPLNYVYTRLSEDAEVGAERLFVADAVDWKPGDRIVIASTTQNPADTEMNRVRSV